MRPDKKEFHVLEELELRFKIDTSKFRKLVEKRQVAVLYLSKQDQKEVCCTILALDKESYCSSSNQCSEFHYASHCNDKEPKFIERVGRMVAFTGAVLQFLGVEPLPGGELESIARSKSDKVVPAIVQEFQMESALHGME